LADEATHGFVGVPESNGAANAGNFIFNFLICGLERGEVSREIILHVGFKSEKVLL
jgi:hypothetical protein